MNEWISVKEKLPEYGDILVTVLPRFGLSNVKVFVAHYSNTIKSETPVFYIGEQFHDVYRDITKRVVAWMPLPEPCWECVPYPYGKESE